MLNRSPRTLAHLGLTGSRRVDLGLTGVVSLGRSLIVCCGVPLLGVDSLLWVGRVNHLLHDLGVNLANNTARVLLLLRLDCGLFVVLELLHVSSEVIDCSKIVQDLLVVVLTALLGGSGLLVGSSPRSMGSFDEL